MLRPKKMSRVSITGSKRYLDDVIEALHELNLVHVIDYDGEWEGFENGTPLEDAEYASEKLVQIRSIENILDIEKDEEEFERLSLDDSEIEEKLEEVRQRVNELQDERDEIRDQLREVQDQRQQLEPFVELGINLELLRGYETIDVLVGSTSNPDEVRQALEDSEGVNEFEVIGDHVVAIAGRTEDDFEISDALVGVDFNAIEVPMAEGSPDDLLNELKTRERKLNSELEGIEDKLEEVKQEAANFLVAAEEKLSIEAQKSEIPLQFATTRNSFVCEGWIPHEKYTDLHSKLKESVGDHVDIEELETATHRPENDLHGHEEEEEEEQPPVIQDNPGPISPFEVLVKTINRPKYSEIDPTIVLFLTFPLFFGFMIGDIGYGILYMVLGYWMYQRFDNPALKSLGGMGMWAAGFTILFGFLYGEFFGIHLQQLLGFHPPYPIESVNKGLHVQEFAKLWLVVSVLFGVTHLSIGWIFGFINDLNHGIKDAVLENLSWLLVLDGVFVWIVADTPPVRATPEFVFTVFNGEPIPLGFAGLPETVGLVGLALGAIGAIMAIAGEGGVGLIEIPTVALVNVLSYTRIGAVLLAKAGMAFVVNLLVFGVYVTEEHHG
ncbi:MAG: V-type ATP synthase subunit I, partial [Halobacteria archaeon]|nr:V-type ATP synthase subunit I [Halobacteria archaeon]